jgi:hypothetical protein
MIQKNPCSIGCTLLRKRLSEVEKSGILVVVEQPLVYILFCFR